MPRSAGQKWGRCPCGGAATSSEGADETQLEKTDVSASANARRKGEYEPRVVEVRMTVRGTVVVLTDVFQGACPNCGSRVYKAEQLARIEETMKGVPLDGRLNRGRLGADDQRIL